MLTLRTATVTISAPDTSIALAICWKLAYFPVPIINLELNSRPAITSLSAASDMNLSPFVYILGVTSPFEHGRVSAR
jgi:hypothetical protein